MNEEEIIRKEARNFYEDKIEMSNSYQAVNDVHELQRRLLDFYSPESKAVFLDEVEKKIKIALQNHRDRAHGGERGVGCFQEEKPEALLYYIKQEFENLPIVVHQ